MQAEQLHKRDLIGLFDAELAAVSLAFVPGLRSLAVGARWDGSHVVQLIPARISRPTDEEKRRTGARFSKACLRDIEIGRADVDADIAPAHLARDHAGGAGPDKGIKHDLAGKVGNGAMRVEAHEARRQLFRKGGGVIAPTLHVLWVYEPDLLAEVEPFGAAERIRLLHLCSELRRLARLHVDIDELDRVVLDDVARIGIASEHHL